MENMFKLNCSLFESIQEDELQHLLSCMNATKKEYAKNSFIIKENDIVNKIYIVRSGECQIIKDDYWGNRTIISKLKSGDLFGEAFASSQSQISKVSVITSSECGIVLIDYNKIITTCSSSCGFHNLLIKNMLKILSAKNLFLTDKIEVLSKRTTREKLLAYFSILAKQNNNKIEVPFGRQELADFLAVDRSALCRELSKMQKERIIKINKNSFILN